MPTRPYTHNCSPLADAWHFQGAADDVAAASYVAEEIDAAIRTLRVQQTRAAAKCPNTLAEQIKMLSIQKHYILVDFAIRNFKNSSGVGP